MKTTTHKITHPIEMTRKYLDTLAYEDIDLKIVFTDPASGKQLRIFAQDIKLMTQSSTFDIGPRSNMEMEFFCQNLQYSDSLPDKKIYPALVKLLGNWANREHPYAVVLKQKNEQEPNLLKYQLKMSDGSIVTASYGDFTLVN